MQGYPVQEQQRGTSLPGSGSLHLLLSSRQTWAFCDVNVLVSDLSGSTGPLDASVASQKKVVKTKVFKIQSKKYFSFTCGTEFAVQGWAA